MSLIRPYVCRAVLGLAAVAGSLGVQSCGPTPAIGDVAQQVAAEPGTWRNSIGMAFRPIPGTNTLMSIYETRVGDFASFVDATGYDATEGFYHHDTHRWQRGGRSWRDPGFEQTTNYPVVGVSWRDAAAFCRWLTDADRMRGAIQPNRAYRLPTEDEWSAASRGDDVPPYPGNFGNYHHYLEFDYFEYTSPAGFFRPNANGFYDMAGNVWEYCLDRFREGDDYRVIRGGCWQNWHTKFLGAQARGRCPPDIRITLYGFRVVLADDDGRVRGMADAAAPDDAKTPAEETARTPEPAH